MCWSCSRCSSTCGASSGGTSSDGEASPARMTFPAPSRLGRPDARVAERLVVLAVGLVAFFLARAALLPGVWFWDTAEAQVVGPLLGVMHPTGFPAYVLL